MTYFQAKQKYNIKPFNDADKDGIFNLIDCRPFDKSRQGIIHAISGYDKENKAKLMIKEAKELLEEANFAYQSGDINLGKELEQQALELAKQSELLLKTGKSEIDTEKKRIASNVKKGLEVKKQKRVKTYTPPFFIVRKEPVEKLYTLPWIRELRKKKTEPKKSNYTPLKAPIYFVR